MSIPSVPALNIKFIGENDKVFKNIEKQCKRYEKFEKNGGLIGLEDNEITYIKPGTSTFLEIWRKFVFIVTKIFTNKRDLNVIQAKYENLKAVLVHDESLIAMTKMSLLTAYQTVSPEEWTKLKEEYATKYRVIIEEMPSLPTTHKVKEIKQEEGKENGANSETATTAAIVNTTVTTKKGLFNFWPFVSTSASEVKTPPVGGSSTETVIPPSSLVIPTSSSSSASSSPSTTRKNAPAALDVTKT